MKATDLMIGDWVQIITIQARVIRLMEHYVDVLTERGTEIHATYQDVSPIPLTKEIVTENGVVLEYGSEQGTDYFFGKFRFSSQDDRFFKWFGETLIYFNYVHELQHAIRVCGLTDLADNFKLKPTTNPTNLTNHSCD